MLPLRGAVADFVVDFCLCSFACGKLETTLIQVKKSIVLQRAALLLRVTGGSSLVFLASSLLDLVVSWQSKRSFEFNKGSLAAAQLSSTSLLLVLSSLDGRAHGILSCISLCFLGSLLLFLLACRKKQVIRGVVSGAQAQLILFVAGAMALLITVVLNVTEKVPELLSGGLLLGFEVPARGHSRLNVHRGRVLFIRTTRYGCNRHALFLPRNQAYRSISAQVVP